MKMQFVPMQRKGAEFSEDIKISDFAGSNRGRVVRLVIHISHRLVMGMVSPGRTHCWLVVLPSPQVKLKSFLKNKVKRFGF